MRAALAGSEVLDGSGRVLRRASGAIFLSGAGAPSGPLRRRAELAELVQEVERGQQAVAAAESALQATSARLAEREKLLADAAAAAEQAREAERQALCRARRRCPPGWQPRPRMDRLGGAARRGSPSG